MYRLGFTVSYIIWHYTYALGELLGIVRNFIWAEYRLFSIPIMIRTLFSPWHRLGEQYHRTIEIGEILGTFIINTIMRIIGLITRSLIIILGLIVIISTIILGVFILFLWTFMPIIVFASFVHGLLILF